MHDRRLVDWKNLNIFIIVVGSCENTRLIGYFRFSVLRKLDTNDVNDPDKKSTKVSYRCLVDAVVQLIGS